MTYKEKVDWLLSYRRQQQRVEELSREMQEMEQVMQSQREQLAVGRNGDWKRARQQQEAETMQERRLVLASEQRRMAALGDAVEAAIGRLEEPMQRRVLRQIYLAGMSQNQVCEQFHYCKRQVEPQPCRRCERDAAAGGGSAGRREGRKKGKSMIE